MPLKPISRVTIRVQDAHHNEGSMSFPALGVPSAADVEAIATLVEAISNGKVCDYTISTGGTFAGKEAAVEALYPDKYEIARLAFIRAADCTEGLSTAVPAPLTSIFVGAANRDVDLSNAGVTALGDALAAIMADSAGNNDFTLDGGYRDTVSAVKPRI